MSSLVNPDDAAYWRTKLLTSGVVNRLRKLVITSSEVQALVDKLGIKVIEIGPLAGPVESHTGAEVLRQLKQPNKDGE